MSREGILDEIEKIVDEAWEVEEKGINTHVNEYQKQYIGHFDRMVKEEHHRHAERYKEQYRREIERRARWDSPMPYNHLTGTSPKTLTHKCDRCQTSVKVVYLQEENHQFNINDAHLIEKTIQVDNFYCPRCRQEIRVVGKILEIRIDMTE